MITASTNISPTPTTINSEDMRNFIFSLILLLTFTACPLVLSAQEKVLTLSEAEAMLEKAQKKYAKAKEE